MSKKQASLKRIITTLLIIILIYVFIFKMTNPDTFFFAQSESVAIIANNSSSNEQENQLSNLLDWNDLNDLHQFQSFMNDSYTIRDIVIDWKHKYLYCDIPKCASTIFKHLFLSIAYDRNHFSFYRGQHGQIKRWQINHNNLEYTNYDYFKSPVWIKLVIIRDPLERLLSAYLNRCFDVNDNHCNKFRLKSGKLPFELFVNKITAILKYGDIRTIKRMDIHWKPQFLSCKLLKYITEFTDVIQYRYSTIANDTFQFLSNYSLEKFFYFENETMNMFDKDTWHKHTNVSKDGSLDDQVAFYSKYYTKRLAIKVIKGYHIDYKLFNMTIPKWVQYLH